MIDASYGQEYSVKWSSCSICGVTDPTVTGAPPVHPDVRTCMNKVQGLPLSTPTPADIAHYTGREPNYYPLDEAERSAIKQAVEDWRDKNLDTPNEHDGDAS